MLKFIGEFVSFIFFLLLMRSVFSGVWQMVRGGMSIPNPSYRQPEKRTSVPATGELRKDPVCGTFVATTSAWTRTIEGKSVYYCSKDCFDKARGGKPESKEKSRWDKSTAARS